MHVGSSSRSLCSCQPYGGTKATQVRKQITFKCVNFERGKNYGFENVDLRDPRRINESVLIKINWPISLR